MFVIRPVKRSDLNQIFALSDLAKSGITTLPHKKDLLRSRINSSLRSFRKKREKPGFDTYLLVLEHCRTKKIVGTCAVISKVGGSDPSYTYKIKTAHKHSKTLKVKKTIQYLQLKREYNGPSEIGTLFLHPRYRQKGVGRLLSLNRFLFIAEHRRRFENLVIAEMRGVIDNKDRSPFWNAVCKHFFVVDFKKADLMVMSDKSFIADLIPQHPIYIPVLPLSAQAVIGQVHRDTVPAFELLKSEGFQVLDEVDIFEAGPVVGAAVSKIRTVKKSRILRVSEISDKIPEKSLFIMANRKRLNNYRATVGYAVVAGRTIVISKEIAGALKVKVGDQLRVVTPKG